MHDREIVAAVVAGDPAGLAAAYDRYAAVLHAYCRSLLSEPADAADAVQDTFVIAAEGYPTQQWTMTLRSRQSLKKFVPLGPKVQPPALALLDIQDGTPGADVYVDGSPEGQIDANGKLIIRVQPGVHTVTISKQDYKSKVIKDINVSKHVLFPNAALTPTRP